MDLEQALQAHAAWTQRLHDAATGAPPALDTARIASAEGCALGEWLQTEGQARLGHRPEWQRCLRVHADFHRAAGAVAAALNRGDTAAARAMLAAGTPYAGASQALAGALRALAQALAQGPVPTAAPGPAATRAAHPRGTTPA
jgi:methyl-accepting chemotaxis protein